MKTIGVLSSVLPWIQGKPAGGNLELSGIHEETALLDRRFETDLLTKVHPATCVSRIRSHLVQEDYVPSVSSERSPVSSCHTCGATREPK